MDYHLTRAELDGVAKKIGGRKMWEIAIQYLGISIEDLEDIQDDLYSNEPQSANFKVLLQWYKTNPRNPRYVSKYQDSLDQCPVPINADQNSGIDPNVDQFRSMPIIYIHIIDQH